jgi:hypothetical protein
MRRCGFGFFPKFSTPVENTVEKQGGPKCLAQKTLFFSVFF